MNKSISGVSESSPTSCSFLLHVISNSFRLTGYLPFFDKNPRILFDKIQKVEYNWDDCPEVSVAAKHFIQHLLVRDPKKRFTAKQALNHPWVKVRFPLLSLFLRHFVSVLMKIGARGFSIVSSTLL